MILLKGGRRGGTIFSKRVPNPKHLGGAGAIFAGGAEGGGSVIGRGMMENACQNSNSEGKN